MSTAGRGSSKSAGLDLRRAVQVLTTGETGAQQRGSGYRVATDAVLTAAHVVHDASSVRLRFFTDHGQTTELPGKQVWIDPVVDIAVLRIECGPDTSGPLTADVPPVRFARITEVVACEALGFPRFKMRRDPTSAGGGHPMLYRDSHHARGTTTPFADVRQGTLELSLRAPEYDIDRNRSPWEGMSGAVVWSGGCLIGVVSEHHRTDGLGTLAASRVDRWHQLLSPARIRELNELIGLPANAAQLEQLPPPQSKRDRSGGVPGPPGQRARKANTGQIRPGRGRHSINRLYLVAGVALCIMGVLIYSLYGTSASKPSKSPTTTASVNQSTSASSLLSTAFEDDAGAIFLQVYSDIVPCSQTTSSTALQARWKGNGCTTATVGDYLEQSRTTGGSAPIMVSIEVISFPSVTDASLAYGYVYGGNYPSTLWCPLNGVGHTPCTEENKINPKTEEGGAFRHVDKYIIWTTSLRTDLSSASNVHNGVVAAGWAGAYACGPVQDRGGSSHIISWS
ncbi:hypothetical protein GQF42_35235 [Streptomyces broussonetiae]|uniref:Trypsin-like serine protease n=1 Tax=Streptomyces broussonetiae TaxID=2686304 RepID=A0A6I6NBR5_9ACTN|nr:serine protease [Streptomyces broussonetiae]QHA07851.1 hypothetical protein GQF42_35235 [Streptomyces broussonetiae]